VLGAWRPPVYLAAVARRASAGKIARSRAGRTPSRRARELQLEFLKELRWGLVGLAILLFAMTVAMLVFVGHPLVALFVGAADASVVWLVVLMVIEATGTSTWRMGAEAERWTAEELAGLGDSWRSVHAIGLPFGDVDHVAVGPGGAYAIETKWTSQTWRSRDLSSGGRLDKAADQVWENRRAVQSRLRVYYERVPVTPVVVIWGKTEDGIAGPHGDVEIIHGSELRTWLAARPHVMDRDAVIGAGDGLMRYQQALRHDRESPSRFVEVGIEGVLSEVSSGVAGGISGVLLGSAVLSQAERTLVVSVGATLALAVAGGAVHRYCRGLVRLFGLGFAVGPSMLLVVVAVTVTVLWFV
jgi:uncharacterized membrane protein